MSTEEVELLSDSKYRQFIAAVEKALRSFESTSEWADLISALGKLNKVLNSYSKYNVIPRKLMIGKRLSQCMHPALPSGVHLKALESYNLIFERIGRKRLSQDLFIYSVGLFPLMSHSAMSVKPVLMKLYEEHFLPLGQALIPSLPGLLLGLLPAIEEGSDYTERIISLLESFSEATDIDVFFDALWQSVITTPAVRLAATIFLLSRLDKHLPPTEQQHLLGKNPAFMVQGLCLALNDSLALVQRNILDFLVQLLPLHVPYLTPTHLSTVMTAGLGVLLRRDMSLNRRLYAWILGGGPSQLSGSTSEDDSNQYFEMFGKKLVVEGMKALFRQHSSPGVDALMAKKSSKLALLKPFRILLNLLDKPEIGSAILEDILIEVFKNLFLSHEHFNPKETTQNKNAIERPLKRSEPAVKQSSSKENPMEELIKTGNLLFNTFEPYFMWQYIAKLLISANRRRQNAGNKVPPGENHPGCEVPSGENHPGCEVPTGGNDPGKNTPVETAAKCNGGTGENDPRGHDPTGENDSTGENDPRGHDPTGENDLRRANNIEDEENDEQLEILDIIRLTDFILNIVALESSIETESKHWPELLSTIIQELTKGCQNLTLDELDGGILLCSKLLSKLTPSTNFGRDGSRDIPSPGFSPTASDFDPGDSIEYDSKTFEDSVEKNSSRESSTPSVGSPRDNADQSRDRKLESCDSFESRESFESRDSFDPGDLIMEGRGDVRSRDKEPGSREQEQTSRDNAELNSENFSIESLEHVLGERFRTPKFEKCADDINSSDVTKPAENGNEKVEESKKREKVKSDSEKRKNESKREKQKNKKEKSRSKDKAKKSQEEKSKRAKDETECLKSTQDRKNEEMAKYDTQSMLIRKCIDHFMDFILEFFRWKIFRTQQAMDVLHDDKFSHVKSIKMRDRDAATCTGHVHCSCSSPSTAAKTYTAMCRFLVELSCFPMQDKGNETDSSAPKKKGGVPLWLRCLIACCYQVDDFDIQSTSVSTVLDLINLTLSVNPGVTCASAGVMVIPILTLDDVVMIEKSDIYKVIANSLWSILGRPIPIHHRKAVELLIQLHNLTPSPHLCENVIGSSMVSTDKESRLEALKRFANLWHIAKSILSQNAQGRTARGLRTFDRSLFVMLDGLESDEPEIRSLTKMWVSHSLEQGDIGRILEPLLLLLLHPSTARVSHFYRERERMRKKESENEADGDATGEQDDDYGQDGILEEMPNANSTKALQRSSDMHKLHYSGKCDYHRILYAFRTLSGVLRVVPRQFVCASAATSIGGSFGPYEERIKELLIRHKRSLLGKGFYGPLFGEKGSFTSPGKFSIKPNTSKYLEILITITLYFIRSHYLPSSNVSAEFLEGNVKTQVSSLECLTNLMWELVKLVRESGHGFGNFITDLLSRCRVQKAIIHCLAATVNETCENPMPSRSVSDALRTPPESSRTSSDRSRPSAESSRRSSDRSRPSAESSRTSSDRSRPFAESSRKSSEETVDHMILQSKLLEVVESLIVLEHALLSCIEALTPDHHGNSDFEIIMKGTEESGSNVEGYTSRFIQGKSLSSQEMLLNMVLYCLKAHGHFEMGSRWTGFVIECLPYLGNDLKNWAVPVVTQMCNNISDVTKVFKVDKKEQAKCSLSYETQYPPDHLLAVLAGLTSICHFCLLDAVSSPILTTQPRAGNTVGSPGLPVDSAQKPIRSTQIFANLLHAFSSNTKASDLSSSLLNPTPLLEAREGLLSILPRVIGTLLSLWGVWNLDEPHESLPSSMALLGTSKALRQNILQLLTPIAMNHTIVFLASVADVWNTKKLTEKDFETKSHFFLAVSDDQLRVISLVLDIKALSLELVIDTVRQILHQESTNRDKGFEASLLQFFHEFLQRSPINHVAQAKSSFLALLKDGLQLNLPPPAVFLLLVNLHTYCVKIPGKEDRKSRKDTQDVAQRLIESCTSIAGLSLGSSAWFSRNLSVITLPETPADESSPQSESDAVGSDVKSEPAGKAVSGGNAGKHSTQALVVLADVLASLLDIVFGSEEKERVVNFLINVMGNVTPYLRNHSVANVPSFRACCALVASLSGYQYTRKAWRKETFELFFETNFFQMASECVGNWRIIIDNLFTQDQASFRELMARAVVTPSAAISIFGNHEQEMKQRASMLKRLSFAVFSSEQDQYQSFLPEFQERLAECLRMPQVPVLHEQVFLFFRVLLVRMSDNMTSIWPMIISEMIHVFLLMESDLLQADTPSRDQQMFYSETVLGASGYVNYSQEKWLGLYLSVCKLLDMAFCLPPEQLPQFQMYRWAFESPGNRNKPTRNVPSSETQRDLKTSETVGDLETTESAKKGTKKSGKSQDTNKSEKKLGSSKATKNHGTKDSDGNVGSIFRPYVSRITKLLAKRKNIYVSEETIDCHRGRPLLTMYQLESVDELLPFLRMLSEDGRILLDMRSSEKSKTRRFKSGNGAKNFLEKLIERDFLEPLGE